MSSVLLISTYELGHQPFGLASPAAWFKAAGAEVACLDLAVQPLNETLVGQAGLIAIYLPMHTATLLAAEIIPQLKSLNPRAHLCCYGLYAPTNESFLRQLGVNTILGGEFETGLLALYDRISSANGQAHSHTQVEAFTSLERQQFLVPDRSKLPGLGDYATLQLPDGAVYQVGYTEASRGCQYLCRHCPIVPVYNGRFRIVQPDIVLADIRQQVAAGARHITFGDPDFLNGPGHAIPIVRALHAEFPGLTYDVTIKIEHLLKFDHLLPTLRDTGCLFITSAVEAVDDPILELMDKGHTRADFTRTAGRLRELGLTLNPTFVAFTPWTTPAGYLEMLSLVRELDLVGNVAPVQYAIRLLIPAGSRLLELPEVQSMVGSFDHSALSYPWQHPDPAMDQLYRRVFRLVQENQSGGESRDALFKRLWQTVLETAPGLEPSPLNGSGWDLSSKPVPRLSESWY
jgi:radical SAM superfamily enzyme YgiQ (UPF0313 family)